MDFATASSSAGIPESEGHNRRDSFSSDEDGLREVLPEELEGMEMQNMDHLELPVPLEAGDGPLAANAQNPHFNNTWDREQSGVAKKLGIIWSLAIITYLFCFSIGYLAILLQPWSPCKRHLHMWAIVTIIIQTIMAATKLHLLIYVWRNLDSFAIPDPALSRRLSLLYFLNRAGNYIWMSWWLTGTVLRFGKAECSEYNLMSLMLVQFIIQWCLAGLVVLAGCCSYGLLAFLYFCFPHALRGGERVVGATHAQIAQLREEKYNPDDTSVKVEDATCAICLSPYEKNDKLRHLPCKHHFHSECIDQWLLKNKSCPFCKRNIDQVDTASAPDPVVDEELGLVELEPSEDEPLNIFPQDPSASSSSSS